MEWPKMDEKTRMERLEIRSGRVDMVLDTDTYNEVDDQFALCYSLLSPERVNLQAVYAAPFHNNRSSGPEDGMEKSYDEIVRLLGTVNVPGKDFVFKGSRSYLPDKNTPVDSPAARDLVARAMARPDGDPLYVAAIGCITDVASALIMEPKLVEKIVVVWLAGHEFSWPHTREFNMMQDIPASQIILDSGVPLVLVPCMGVASHLTASTWELDAHGSWTRAWAAKTRCATRSASCSPPIRTIITAGRRKSGTWRRSAGCCIPSLRRPSWCIVRFCPRIRTIPSTTTGISSASCAGSTARASSAICTST